MKFKSITNSGFNPATIELTFDSQQELNRFTALCNLTYVCEKCGCLPTCAAVSVTGTQNLRQN